MPRASDLTPETRFIGLFIGKSGSGKTCAACSFPGPIEVMDFDGRIRGIMGAPWIKKEDIMYEFYPPKEDGLLQKIMDKLNTYYLQYKMGQTQILPRTVILDSLTSETLAVVQQALKLTHEGTKGKKLGNVMMPGPEDYGVEANFTYQMLAALRSLPIQNVIVSAHIVDKYGKPPGTDNPYADSVVIGEKLSIRDKISENTQIYFDHIFRFDRKEVGNSIRFYVKYWSDLARTSFTELPTGEIDITGKNFYEDLMQRVKKGA